MLLVISLFPMCTSKLQLVTLTCFHKPLICLETNKIKDKPRVPDGLYTNEVWIVTYLYEVAELK